VLGLSSYTTTSSAPKTHAARASWPAIDAAASCEDAVSRMEPGIARLKEEEADRWLDADGVGVVTAGGKDPLAAGD